MSNPTIPPGRASTFEEKMTVIGHLLLLWEQCPHQRLGQLIYNATYGDDLFAIEDDKLLSKLKSFGERMDNLNNIDDITSNILEKYHEDNNRWPND